LLRLIDFDILNNGVSVYAAGTVNGGTGTSLIVDS